MVVDGGMELPAIVVWLFHRVGVAPSADDVQGGLRTRSDDPKADERKLRLIDDRPIDLVRHQLGQAA